MTDRAGFLDRLRSRLGRGTPRSLSHPVVPVADVPPVRYAQDLDDPVEAFARNAALQGTDTRRVTTLAELLSDIVRELDARTAVVSGDPETEGAREELERLGIDVLPFDGPRGEADLGVVGAAWGIAATGSVVFDAAAAGGRSASLLPPAVVVLLRADRVVREAGDIFRRMDERFPGGLPSQLVLTTGPSKSGDIELELTTGVHGPGRLWVGLL